MGERGGGMDGGEGGRGGGKIGGGRGILEKGVRDRKEYIAGRESHPLILCVICTYTIHV